MPGASGPCAVWGAGPERAPSSPRRRRPRGDPTGSPASSRGSRSLLLPLSRRHVPLPCLCVAFAVQRTPALPCLAATLSHSSPLGTSSSEAHCRGCGPCPCRCRGRMLPPTPALARPRVLSVGSRSRPAGRCLTPSSRAAPLPLASTSVPGTHRIPVTPSPFALSHGVPERHHGTGRSRPPAGVRHRVRPERVAPPLRPRGSVGVQAQPSGHGPTPSSGDTFTCMRFTWRSVWGFFLCSVLLSNCERV